LNDCVAGQFTDSGNNNACAPCTAGTYSTDTSALTPATACTACLAGTHSQTESATSVTECVQCEAG